MVSYILFKPIEQINFNAEVVELADASDSKSDIGDNVRVQVPPSAPNKNSSLLKA